MKIDENEEKSNKSIMKAVICQSCGANNNMKITLRTNICSI